MERKEASARAFSVVESELVELSDWMYYNPETAYEEFETSRRLAEWLARFGDVRYPAYDMSTAFELTIGHDGPRVIVCAEYDALPGVGHACGHNLIATSALGTVAALADQVDDLGIQLTVLGTPAEELIGGKVDLINVGAFENAAAVMMIHPAPVDALDPEILAVRHLEVVFTGKDSHAAFAPQLGINALDAFVQAYVNISTLRQALYPTDKVHGIITHGGDAPNVIPARTESAWYVRAYDDLRLAELTEKVTDCFEAAAKATGCEVVISDQGHAFSSLRTNPVLAEMFDTNAGLLDRTLARGRDLPPGASGSTDMGNVSQLVPTIHPLISIDSLPAVNHQPEFAAHTMSEAGHRAIRDGALAMAWTIIDAAEHDRWEAIASTFQPTQGSTPGSVLQ